MTASARSSSTCEHRLTDSRKIAKIFASDVSYLFLACEDERKGTQDLLRDRPYQLLRFGVFIQAAPVSCVFLKRKRVGSVRYPMWVPYWLPSEDRFAFFPGRLRDAVADAEGRHSAAPAVIWPASPPAVSSSYLAPRAPVWLVRWSLWPPLTPFSASFADSGTRFWSVVPSGRVHARSLFVVVALDSDWSEILFLIPVFGTACTFADLCASGSHSDLKMLRNLIFETTR